MLSFFKNIALSLDDLLFRRLVKILYPKYKRPRFGYTYNYRVLLNFAIAQKILRINSKVPWPVDFRSRVIGHENIKKGKLCDPGDSMGVYINGSGGIEFGDNVEIGPNTIITSVNHSQSDPQKYSERRGITIGSNVWIGANCSILVGAIIGDNVTIGAGCVVDCMIPPNSIVKSGSRELKIIQKRIKPVNVEFGDLN
jgi:acetyltransferase-like isoleucine patch superfamily enzyme